MGVLNVQRGQVFAAGLLSTLLMVLMVGALALTASPASANDIVCSRSGATLSWASTNSTIHVRGFTSTQGDDSAWLATVDDGNNTYVVTDADLAKAPGDRFFIRYRIAGEVFDSPCDTSPEPPAELSCTQDGALLTWDDIEVSRGLFHVRSVEADGSTSWVASVRSNSYAEAIPGETYEIRYRITSSPGNTEVFNVVCDSDGTPPPNTVTCGVETFGFQTETGFDIFVDGAADGVSYTLFLDGEASGTNAFPVEVIEFTGREANDLFRIDTFGRSLVIVEIAPTNDLDARIPCGSFGQDPEPVASCTAFEGDAGQVELVLSPEYVSSFEVSVDGAILDAQANTPGFPINALPFSYTVDAPLTGAFTIVQDAGNVECSGDEVNFCTQAGGNVEWLAVNGAVDGEYNIRRVNLDGSTTWVLTTFFSTFASPGEGDFLVRYRVEGAAGNPVIVDNLCVPE